MNMQIGNMKIKGVTNKILFTSLLTTAYLYAFHFLLFAWWSNRVT